MKDIVLTLLFLAIAHSEAQVSTLTYMFPEDRDITICPAIIRSPSRPSFRLEPFSATRNVLFLLGTYDASDTTIMEAVIDPENSTCMNGSAMCSKLSLRYSGMEVRGMDSFTITYTASNGVMRRIRVKFGYAGLYLQNETGGMIVGRVPNNLIAANNSLVIFGTVARPVTCLENGAEAPNSLLTLVPSSFTDEECFGNNQTNSQPGLLTVFFADMNRTGQERIYFVDNTDCSGRRISDTFLFIFDPPLIDPDSTPTDPITNVTPTPSPPTATQLGAIGIGVGVGGAIAVVSVLLLVSFLAWYRKKKRRKVKYSDEKGSTVSGTRSKLSSVSTIDGGESSPTLLISSRNGHVRLPMPAPTRKNLYVVKYTDSAAMIAIEDTLAELNEDRYKHVATQENGFLPTYMTNIIAAGHRVIILYGSKPKESVSQSDDIATRWIKELESSPRFTDMRLDNVFVVYLGCNQPPPVIQQIPRLQRIPISQHPDDESSNFDPLSIAKKIQDEIVKLSPVNRLQSVAANVPVPPPPPSSTGSRTPAGSADPSPLVTRNLGAEHPHEHLSASSTEHSLSPTIEDKPEDRTGQTDTSGTLSATKKFLDKTTGAGELKGPNSTASTPTAARSQGGGDALESSPSAPAIVQMEKGELKDMLREVMKDAEQGIKDKIEEVKDKVEEVKDKVEQAEEGVKEKVEEVKDKVEEKVEEVKDKVEEKGEEIKDEVEEQGNRLSESIEVVADEIEQTRTELQNWNIEVIQPHNDEDEGGRETGDVGGASTRQDTS